jgi:hypothetical protein
MIIFTFNRKKSIFVESGTHMGRFCYFDRHCMFFDFKHLLLFADDIRNVLLDYLFHVRFFFPFLLFIFFLFIFSLLFLE